MGTKILFIEDDVKTLKEFWIALRETGNGWVDSSDSVPVDFAAFNKYFEDKNSPVISITQSFSEAINIIKNINPNEYGMIFIDRNLETYPDVAIKQIKVKDDATYSKDFFDFFDKYLGDYLYFRLVDAGVPKEKLCFLTANNPQANMPQTDFKTNLFVRHEPQSISKLTSSRDTKEQSNVSSFMAALNNPQVTDERLKIKNKELIACLRELNETSVRFKYSNIFNNKKVNEIFKEDNILCFIAMLAKRYKDGLRAQYINPDDGILLRKMIEDVVSYIVVKFFSCQWPPGSIVSVRGFLNNQCNYKANLPSKDHWDMFQNWLKLSVELGHFPISTEDQNYIENTYFPNLEKNTGIKKVKKDAEEIIKYSTAKVLHLLYDHFYKGNSSPNIPKYIFSYIDNIYTVTSELSAHGKNTTTTKDLSPDGWSALLSGMIQIMQWVTDTNPNPTSPQN